MPIKLSHLPRGVESIDAESLPTARRDTEASGVISIPLPPLVTLATNANIAYNIFSNPRHARAAQDSNPVAHDRLNDVLRALAALRAALAVQE